jgi:hypothetical protein
MSPATAHDFADCFILPNVEPLLSEVVDPVSVRLLPMQAFARSSADDFVRRVFAHAYGAEVRPSYPMTLAFSDRRGLRAVVGFRDAAHELLFVEQYLDVPITDALRAQVGAVVPRHLLVEVGNLALESVGDARWVIAATTLFLHALDFQYAIFTATRMLQNAFQRIGLQPVALCSADPSRLADGGEDWGDYYRTRPTVCAGRIVSGYRKLVERRMSHQPRLHALFADVRRLASAIRRDAGDEERR